MFCLLLVLNFLLPSLHPYHVNFWQLLNTYATYEDCRLAEKLLGKTHFMIRVEIRVPAVLTDLKACFTWQAIFLVRIEVWFVTNYKRGFVWRNFFASCVLYSLISFIVFALLFSFVVFSIHSQTTIFQWINVEQKPEAAFPEAMFSNTFPRGFLFQCCVEK